MSSFQDLWFFRSSLKRPMLRSTQNKTSNYKTPNATKRPSNATKRPIITPNVTKRPMQQNTQLQNAHVTKRSIAKHPMLQNVQLFVCEKKTVMDFSGCVRLIVLCVLNVFTYNLFTSERQSKDYLWLFRSQQLFHFRRTNSISHCCWEFGDRKLWADF